MLSGIIITQRDVIIVTRREKLFIFMKHEEFGYHELHLVKKWVRFIREGSESHTFEGSEEREERGEGKGFSQFL